MVAQAADAFTRANGGLGANYTTGSGEGAIQIISNVVDFSGNGLVNDQSGFWSGTLTGGGTTWANDQYSKAVLPNAGTAGGEQGTRFVVRHAAAARTYYWACIDHAATANVLLGKFNAGVHTVFGSAVTQAWTNGDTWELDIVGTTLTLKLNGATVTSATDSAITAGNPGFGYSSTDNGTNTLANWEGGDFTSGSAAVSGSTAAQGAATATLSVSQIAMPSADVSAVWTSNTGATTSLYSYIDEVPTPNDSDYIQSPLAPANSEQKVRLQSVTNPQTTSGFSVSFRYGKNLPLGSQEDVTVTLYAADGVTVIASQTVTAIGDSVAYGSFTLTGTQAASIPSADYATGLVLGFKANQTLI